MRYQQLGSSGLTVSAVGYGCNSFGVTLPADKVSGVVQTAIDEGITLFDTADVYGSYAGEGEELLGRALRGKRDDVIIATKFGMDTKGANGRDWGVRGSRRYINRAVDASLQRLGTDWIDLYQMHAPDPLTPIEETLSALDDLKTAGKIRYIGCSNFAAWQVVDAHWSAVTNGFEPFISAQNAYSLLDLEVEEELVPALEHLGLGLLPFYPLASGLLTGKYRRAEKPPAGSRLENRPERIEAANFDLLEALEKFAAARELDLLEVAIGGLLAQPGVDSVISGARTSAQISANVRAGLWEPDLADLAELDEVVHRV